MSGGISRTELQSLVSDRLKSAFAATKNLQLEKVAKAMLGDVPELRRLNLGFAVKATAVVLFVDLRGSTTRALRVGARDTFLTMHALLPPLAYLVESHGGYIGGYRGDGLFGLFGLDETGRNPQNQDFGKVIGRAAACGQLMLEAVDGVVNPALHGYGVEAGLQIGVGIDGGTIILTRIGLEYGFDTTAYGDSINNASKLCGEAHGQVLLSATIDSNFPEGPPDPLTTVITTTLVLGGRAFLLNSPSLLE